MRTTTTNVELQMIRDYASATAARLEEPVLWEDQILSAAEVWNLVNGIKILLTEVDRLNAERTDV